MSLAIIKDNHIELFGTKYFVANAQLVSIGSYGPKATPVFGQNKLEVKDHIPAPKFKSKIKTVPPISIDTTKSSKADFTSMITGSVKVVGFSGSESAVYDELANKKLKLIQLFVEDNVIKDAVNNSPKVIDDLVSYGGDARVASSLIVIAEATFADSFTSGSSFDVSADALGIISIEASGGSTVSGKTKITLSSGTGIGYLLLKMDWNKNKTAVETTIVDEWSIN